MEDDERTQLLPPVSFRSLPINSREPEEDEDDDGYVDYKRRWYILAVVFIVNVSNAMVSFVCESVMGLTLVTVSMCGCFLPLRQSILLDLGSA